MAAVRVEERVVDVIERLRWAADSRYAAAASVAGAALAVLAIGSALAWKPTLVVVGAVAFAFSTYLARSIARSLACLFGALGTLAAAFGAAVMVDASLLASLHVTWSAAVLAWWALAVGYAVLIRRGGYEADFGLAELAGVAVTILAALSVWRKVDYSTGLLRLLVHVEDNEAWTALVTQAHSATYIGPGFEQHFDGRGPVIATILGLLAASQRADVPVYNAAFSGWALAVLLAPICAAVLMRRIGARSAIATVVFAAIVIAWAWQVPFLLFAQYGHLTATWAFLFLLVSAAMLAFDRQRAAAVPALTGLLFAAGAVWYPIFPIGGLALLLVIVRGWRGERAWARWSSIIIAATGGVVLIVSMGQAIGIINPPPDVPFGLKNLYAAQGGTASFDGTLQMLVPVALVLLALLPSTRVPEHVEGLWRMLVVCVAYVGAVFAGAYFVKVGVGYGPTKVWFILGFAVTVALVATASRFDVGRRAVVAMALALTMGSLFYGGAGAALSRSWPGGGSDPAWLPAVQAVAAASPEGRPTACVSNDKYAGYLCTRWAAGLTTGDDFPYLFYRLSVAGDQDPSAQIKTLIDDGTVAKSDIIVLDAPDEGHAWAWPLIAKAGQVYGPDGKPLDPRPTPGS